MYNRAMDKVMGRTLLWEWLLVEVDALRLVPVYSPLWNACQRLNDVGKCGVIEDTLVIDLCDATPEERALLLGHDWSAGAERPVVAEALP